MHNNRYQQFQQFQQPQHSQHPQQQRRPQRSYGNYGQASDQYGRNQPSNGYGNPNAMYSQQQLPQIDGRSAQFEYNPLSFAGKGNTNQQQQLNLPGISYFIEYSDRDGKKGKTKIALNIFLLPGTPASNSIISQLNQGEYYEIAAKDLRRERPPWVKGAPTVVCMRTNKIIVGTPAVEYVNNYIKTQKALSGSQDECVVSLGSGYGVGNIHQMENDVSIKAPVGETGDASGAAEFHGSRYNDPRYNVQHGSINDNEFQQYMRRRQKPRPPPNNVKYEVSTLGDDYVTM